MILRPLLWLRLLPALILMGCAASASPAARMTAAELAEVAALPQVPPGLNGNARVVLESAGRVRATLGFRASSQSVVANEWILFLPSPPDLPGQRVRAITPHPGSRTIRELSPLARNLLETRIPGPPSNLHSTELNHEFEISLASRKLVLHPPSNILSKVVPPLPAAERALALRRDKFFDYHHREVRAWTQRHGLVRSPRESEIDFARRVYQKITGNVSYHYADRHQDRSAAGVCTTEKSDCGGMTILFATILRSQGIPARVLAGRWAVSAKPGEKVGLLDSYQEHVKAEFHAHGTGWVPVDLSLGAVVDRSPGRLKYFGTDAGKFITFHVDPGIVVDTIHFGRRSLALLQFPAMWVSGRGRLGDPVLHHSWEVTRLAAAR